MAALHQAHIKKEPGDSLETMPDSTTKERSGFSEGEDVLCQQKDGRFYLGTVVLVELNNERCLVKFGDNTQRWSKFKELCRLSMNEEKPVCVVCKKSSTGGQHGGRISNEIICCDKCNRGYHQQCHQPKVLNAGEKFVCCRCVVVFKPQPPPQQQQQQQQQQQPPPVKPLAGAVRKQGITRTCKKVLRSPSGIPISLPYDPGELTWDVNHRTNSEQRYCYCGKPGEWFMQMVQCGRCRQWFHEGCLQCLQFPLFCGDRFYVFVCSLCNEGKEFIRRLELDWIDLVHVALYNLTLVYQKKYYDLDTMIVPYINERWEEWQLPAKLYTATMRERRDQVIAVLQDDRVRFKCGREIKKRTSIWGLRNRLAPFAPSFSLPTEGVITEEILKQLCEGNKRLRFLTASKGIPGGEMWKIVKYESVENGVSRPPGPPRLVPDGKLKSHILSRLPSPDDGELGEDSPLSDCSEQLPTKKLREIREKTCQVERQRRRKRWRQQTRRAGLRLLESRSDSKQGDVSSSSCVLLAASCKLSLSQEGKDSLLMAKKKARKLVKDAISKGQQKNVRTSSSPSRCESTAATQTNGIPSAPCSTPVETSGDETSSRGTLDLFIPPPKDFVGPNNPFLTVHTSTPVQSTTPTPVAAPVQAPPPTPPKINVHQKPVQRATKRQLSERDIRIGKNGEVKRRRFRRRNGLSATKIPASNLYSQYQHDTTVQDNVRLRTTYHRSSKASSPPPMTSRSGSTCVDNALNSGRLRSRVSKESKEPPSSPEGSDVGTSATSAEPVSIEDIKSSLNHYFGAANRIASGENFKILAKRTLPNGKQQFLLEWDSPAS